MSGEYPVPAGFLECETEVKKSRFVARVVPVATREEVKAWLEQAHCDHPEARHICWAYQIGRPGAAAEAAMNDDGEPSGTAGKPILNVIQHKDMGDVLVMVIRYFGGVKLGAGGLARAYSGAAQSVLAAVERHVPPSLEAATVTLSFADEQGLRHWCELHGAAIDSVDYTHEVTARVRVPSSLTEAFSGFCLAQKMNYSFDS